MSIDYKGAATAILAAADPSDVDGIAAALQQLWLQAPTKEVGGLTRAPLREQRGQSAAEGGLDPNSVAPFLQKLPKAPAVLPLRGGHAGQGLRGQERLGLPVLQQGHQLGQLLRLCLGHIHLLARIPF